VLHVLSRPGTSFGCGLDSAGDVDGDGTPDILVGIGAFAGTGSVDVYSGLDGTLLHCVVAPEPMDDFGTAVAGVGDVNADGRDDFLVGADRGTGGSGRAYLYSGLDGSLIRTLSHGGAGQAGFGTAVAGGRDVDGDGTPDLLVGAPLEDGAGADAGRAYLFSGSDGSLLQEFQGPAAEARLPARAQTDPLAWLHNHTMGLCARDKGSIVGPWKLPSRLSLAARRPSSCCTSSTMERPTQRGPRTT
jgi:hypothetical protein